VGFYFNQERKGKMVVYLLYEGEKVGEVVTNRSLILDEIIRLAGIDIEEKEDGQETPKWDYNLFDTEIKQDYQLRQFAENCASAYIAQYVDDRAVMGDPIVTFNRRTEKFDWQSSLIPLDEEEISLTTIHQGDYGDTEGLNIEEIRAGIIDCITSSLRYAEFLEMTEPEN